MILHPDLLFSKLDSLLNYPNLYHVLMDNPAMLFDSGNMANILSNAKVTNLLFSNSEFTGFLLHRPEFPKLLMAEDWLVHLPAMTDFLTNNAQFLDSYPEIGTLLK